MIRWNNFFDTIFSQLYLSSGIYQDRTQVYPKSCWIRKNHSVGGKHKPFTVEVLQCHTESMEATPERDQTPEDQDETVAQPTIITLIPVAQEEIPTMPEMSQPNETNNNTIVTNAVVINTDGSAKVVGKGKDVYFFFVGFHAFLVLTQAAHPKHWTPRESELVHVGSFNSTMCVYMIVCIRVCLAPSLIISFFNRTLFLHGTHEKELDNQ